MCTRMGSVTLILHLSTPQKLILSMSLMKATFVNLGYNVLKSPNCWSK